MIGVHNQGAFRRPCYFYICGGIYRSMLYSVAYIFEMGNAVRTEASHIGGEQTVYTYSRVRSRQPRTV